MRLILYIGFIGSHLPIFIKSFVINKKVFKNIQTTLIKTKNFDKYKQKQNKTKAKISIFRRKYFGFEGYESFSYLIIKIRL